MGGAKIFEAVNSDGIERTANQVSERVLNWVTLGSLAVAAEFEQETERFSGVPV